MPFKWESEEDRLLRFMKIPPEKKLQWLRDMKEFNERQSRRVNSIRKKLRAI